jgi:hypothetical protein
MTELDKQTSINTFIIIAVTGSVFAYCHITNKNKEAELYYYEFEPVKYYVLKFCYLILVVSLLFNMRFLFSTGVKRVASVLKRWVSR